MVMIVYNPNSQGNKTKNKWIVLSVTKKGEEFSFKNYL